MEYRGIRYRLYPKTRQKAEMLHQCLGATRYVWNHFLAQNRQMMEAHRNDESVPRPKVSFFSLGKEFVQLRRQTDWLQKLPCAPIRYTLKYYSDAWKQCFGSGKGFPKFKSRASHSDSVTFVKGTFQLNGNSLHLQKIGQVVLSGSHLYTDAEPVSVVIQQEDNRLYATVSYQMETIQRNDNGKAIGVDMNVRQFATSEGEIRRMPRLDRLEARRRRYQRMMARRQKPRKQKDRDGNILYISGSKRYEQARLKASRASRRIRNIRGNWHHQESRKIADQSQYVVVENLNTRGMTKSAKGDRENPGRNVKQKSGLNREILNTGWSGFKQKLGYKSELIEVDPKNTSRRCHACGHIDQDNRRTQDQFRCVECGHRDNADINAALNILALGTRVVGRGRGDCVGNLDDPSRKYTD